LWRSLRIAPTEYDCCWCLPSPALLPLNCVAMQGVHRGGDVRKAAQQVYDYLFPQRLPQGNNSKAPTPKAAAGAAAAASASASASASAPASAAAAATSATAAYEARLAVSKQKEESEAVAGKAAAAGKGQVRCSFQ
jgi:hypothetical protein